MKGSKPVKKYLFIALIALAFALSSCIDTKPTAAAVVKEAQAAAAVTALDTIPIPEVSYFAERRTIAKWTERWDRPNIPTFVYVYSYGTCIGYFVADGKPASTRSYLMPEERTTHGDLGEYGGDLLVSAPDIDGTYGDNNPGWRIFTAEGIAVGIEGAGVFLVYSDAPLNLDVPELYKK